MHRLNVSQKFSKDVERVMYQGSRHREEQERVEMEKQGALLEKLAQRKKALADYEKKKRKAATEVEQKNQQKFAMT